MTGPTRHDLEQRVDRLEESTDADEVDTLADLIKWYADHDRGALAEIWRVGLCEGFHE